jgi:hypothetical protein
LRAKVLNLSFLELAVRYNFNRSARQKSLYQLLSDFYKGR